MLNKTQLLDQIDNGFKVQIDLNTRVAEEVRTIVEYLVQNKERYGQVDDELLQYGRLYLKTDSREQRIAFLEDVFSRANGNPLTMIQNIDYLATQCHVPENIGSPYITSAMSPKKLLALVEEYEQHPKPSITPNLDEALLVKIAVVDTGIDYNHSLLYATFDPNARGRNFVEDFRGGVKPHPREFPIDQNGHGTHIAGILISGEPNIRLYSLKCQNFPTSLWLVASSCLLSDIDCGKILSMLKNHLLQ